MNLGAPRNPPWRAAAHIAAWCAITFAASLMAVTDITTAASPQDGRLALGASEPHAYVETVTFTKYPSDAAAVDDMVAGELDMYYYQLLAPEIQRVLDAGHDIYETPGGVAYVIFVNPTDDTTNGFNPFAHQKVRFALNYMIDRDEIVKDVLGAGAQMLSALPSTHPDYLLVHRSLQSLGISYDPARAESMIEEAIISAGASKSPSGAWEYGGQPIAVNVFIRSDDPVRLQIGENLADGFRDMGFEVSRTYGDLYDAFYMVDAVDPAEQTWHLYTEAWTTPGGGVGYDDGLLGSYYARWGGYMPGFVEEHYWQYQNDEVEDITAMLRDGGYGSPEERASLVSQAAQLGVRESVRVFLANSFAAYPVSSGVSGEVVSPDLGTTTRYTPINAQLSGGDTSLDIGSRHVVQTSWNPVGGFGDSYSADVWGLLHDASFARDPNTDELFDGRNALVSAATEGPDGKLAVHPDAVMWSPGRGWMPTNETEATSVAVLDLRFANWHHGQPMDLNDFMYHMAFNAEYRSASESEPDLELGRADDYVAVRVLDGDTVEVYTNYWSPDRSQMVANAGFWPSLPWEIVAAMDAAVLAETADWSPGGAHHHSGNWLDMLDRSDAELIRGHLVNFSDPSHPDHIPDFLYEHKTSSYASARYDAAISWIDSMGHMVISSGPFSLGDIERESDAQDAAIIRVTLDRFDDPSYPFPRGHWASFADFERLSGDVEIGSLAPVTGGAFRYGVEAQSAYELAESDFNDYLEARGEKWSLRVVPYDTETNTAKALEALVHLNEQRGVRIASGPTIDMYTGDILDYARDNNMVLLSCCASTPAAAIPGDTIFRLLPDQRMHADAIVRLVADEVPANIRHVITLGIDSPWATELIEATYAGFEQKGVSVSPDIITFPLLADGESVSAAVAALAQRVEEAVSQQGGDASRVAVLYVGFADGPVVLEAASAHDILDNVRWFGADQNTASPNVADNPASAAFAQKVSYVVVQPSAPYVEHLTDHIHAYQESRGITPSTYSSYAYDTIWLLGLSILEAQSADPDDVLSRIGPTAELHVGAIGSTKLNENGDLAEGQYASWLFADGGWSEYDPADYKPKKTGCR